MKKILLITLVGTIFAVASANACDTCAKHTHKADGTHEACAADCDKKCCAETKAACCAEGCTKPCCAEKKAACKEGCTKPCCAEKADTAAKAEAAAPCCEAILGKAA